MSDEGSADQTFAQLFDEDARSAARTLSSRGYVAMESPDGQIYVQGPGANYCIALSGCKRSPDGQIYIESSGAQHLLSPDSVFRPDILRLLQEPGLDSIQEAVVNQLKAWERLADFAKSLSIGLAIGSGVLALFMLAAMTWGDLFTGSSMWEFGVILFALAVFIASPLAIFVIGRPLKGVDEWSPTLPSGTKQ